MIKRLLYLFLILMTVAPATRAQLAVGSWKQYPVFGNKIGKIIDTPDKVFYINEGFLYGYDKKNDEKLSFESANALSDVGVSDIFYNFDKHYLAIAYSNSNLDLLYDDGNLVNLPEIKDASVNIVKAINNIAFDADRMYVSTNFGLVVYDDERHEVKESGIYNRNVLHAVPLDSHLVIDVDKTLYSIPRGERISKFDNFTKANGDNQEVRTFIVTDGAAGQFVGNLPSVLRFYTLDPATGLISYSNRGGYTGLSDLIKGKDAIYFTSSRSEDATPRPVYFYSFTSTADISNLKTIPSAIDKNLFSTYNGLSRLWGADASGLACYNLSGDNLTVVNDKFLPGETISVTKIAFITPTADKTGFYIYNMGRSNFHPGGSDSEGSNICQQIDLIQDDVITDIAPDDVSAKLPNTIMQQRGFGKKIINPEKVVQDPDDPSIIYMGSSSEGIYVIKDGEEIGKFDGDNTNFPKYGVEWRVQYIDIDRAGNLWVAFHNDGSTVSVLPASKRRLDPKTIKASDWIDATPVKEATRKDPMVFPCEKSNIVLIYNGYHTMHAYDTRGSYENFTDDTFRSYTGFTDQDGKSVNPARVYTMAEDHDGKVWLGTEIGVFEITRPAEMMGSDFRINRIKVPRNDGTNLADYLLEKEFVSAISVDNSNRKWIGTLTSGLYLVNSTGTEIIDHLTAENSQLPSNEIYAVYADPTSNIVYVATPYGLSAYSSSSSPARPDYSDVYAYPNPVTPDFSGWITIIGLMEDSRVKICDSAMNVVYETQSEGGMATWDGCNFSGARVKSGVYYVLASTGANASSSAGDVVTKILVVN